MSNRSLILVIGCVGLSFASRAEQVRAASDDVQPNILVCIADDWGWPHAGVYGAGNWIETPNFDRVAREGVLFRNCFTSNPKCCPCRASILAGRNTWQMKEAVNHVCNWPKEFAAYPDLFMAAGYHVGFTGKGWGPGNFMVAGRQNNPAGPNYDKFRARPPVRGMSNKDYARNFIENFMPARPSKDTPFCFWLGTHEPHRTYEDGAGLRAGKQIGQVELPAYYPDNPRIRSDMLDYAVEVEHFDRHVGRVLEYLDSIGELDQTIVLVTSDHGMPFPRVKGQIYEHGFHLPLAVRWGAKVKGGRDVSDFINVRDFAPTFLEAAEIPAAAQITGTSFVDLLLSEESGIIDPATRNTMLIGKERHDLGRPHDWGYPVRAIRTVEYLYVHNYEPNRWPVGNPETGYRNCDDSPTKSMLLGKFDRWYQLSFAKRPEDELYRVTDDPDCIKNLADLPAFSTRMTELRAQMEALLKEEGDPRMLGEAAWFDTIEYTGRRSHAWDTWQANQTLEVR
jgi:N-sulfoglucosamine sulfohydrolase